MSDTHITDTVGVYVEGDSPPEASGSGVAWPAIIGGRSPPPADVPDDLLDWRPLGEPL